MEARAGGEPGPRPRARVQQDQDVTMAWTLEGSGLVDFTARQAGNQVPPSLVKKSRSTFLIAYVRSVITPTSWSIISPASWSPSTRTIFWSIRLTYSRASFVN